MQNPPPPPPLSPDGNYWWDGQAWQLMPGRIAATPAAATPAAQPTTGTPRPAWLPEEVPVPVPAAPPDLPFVPQPVGVGAIGGPAVYAPVWANEPPAPPEPISIPKKILCWAGLVVGGGFMLWGILLTPFAMAQGGVTREEYFATAVLIVVLGGLVAMPCLGVLLGFGPAVAGTFHSLGILGVIYVLGSILNASVAVTNPMGGTAYVIPWTMLGVVAFRAWRGRWVGAILILVTWAISTAITLFMARS
ncbi:MAG TPA: hypothetical protein VF990_00910 [Candidatus Dormibacteraeota bacterium]